LEQALLIDPEFADAYAWLAFRKSGIADSPQEANQIINKYSKKALEIDENNYLAHGMLARGYTWYEWDFNEAYVEYRKAKELHPLNNELPHTDLLIAIGKSIIGVVKYLVYIIMVNMRKLLIPLSRLKKRDLKIIFREQSTEYICI